MLSILGWVDWLGLVVMYEVMISGSSQVVSLVEYSILILMLLSSSMSSMVAWITMYCCSWLVMIEVTSGALLLMMVQLVLFPESMELSTDRGSSEAVESWILR